MDNPRVKSWRLDESMEGLLFFAQRMEEGVHDYSLDSYKAPALNSHTRCLELSRVVEDVRRGVIMAKTIRPVVEELCASLAKDRAARQLAGTAHADLTSLAWWQTDDPGKVAVKAEFLRGLLWKRAYEKKLRELATQLIPEGKQKREIQDVALNLAVEWMLMRYSRDYIYYRTRAFFFSMRKVSRAAREELEEFFSHFDEERRLFDVCIRAAPSFMTLREMLPTEVAIVTADPPPCRSTLSRERLFLERPHDGAFIVVPRVEALDARSAGTHALRRLENITTFATYHIHRTPLSWDGNIVVWENDHPTVLKTPKLPVQKEDECSHEDLPERLSVMIGSLGPSELPQESWVRIRSALGLHSSAIASEDVSVQLTTLWSAIETLIPPSVDEARINQLTSVVLPVLSAGYPRKLFLDLDTALRRCVGDVYSEVVDALSDSERWIRCAKVIAVRANESLRDTLYSKMNANPLLRFRTHQLMQSFSTAESILKTVVEHDQRIGWHLRRIYRTRNLLVHAGHSLPYREAVVENLHSYFHRIMNAIERRFSQDVPPVSLDAALIAERVAYEGYLRSLRAAGSAAVTESSVDTLLGGY